MAFLTDNDYKTLIATDDLDVIQNSDVTVREAAEKTAIEYIKGFTRSRYDMDYEFALSGDDRNPVLVMYIMDEVLYILHTSVPGRMVPETRELRKEQFDKWLDKVQRGIVTPSFKLLDDEDGESDPGNPVKYGGNTSVSGSW